MNWRGRVIVDLPSAGSSSMLWGEEKAGVASLGGAPSEQAKMLGTGWKYYAAPRPIITMNDSAIPYTIPHSRCRLQGLATIIHILIPFWKAKSQKMVSSFKNRNIRFLLGSPDWYAMFKYESGTFWDILPNDLHVAQRLAWRGKRSYCKASIRAS
jgi:hypothetical protein